MNRTSSLLAKYERLSIIPLSMIALGIVLAFVAEPLGAYWGGLAFVGALVLILGGVLLLFLYSIVKVAIWVLQRVGTTAGLIVEETDPPPPTEPVPSGPSWRVTLPDGSHTVYLEDNRWHPARLACDGRWVELRWWDGGIDGLASFTIAGHAATVSESSGIRRSGLRFRRSALVHGLRVDGASVEPLDGEAIRDVPLPA